MKLRLVGAAFLVVVLALLAGACGDDGGSGATSTPEPTAEGDVDVVIALEIVDGELVGGSQQRDVGLGDSVAVVVTGNSDDQVHVHGYDLFVDLDDGAGRTEFDALIPGTFEIELEQTSRLLVRMTVS